MQLRFGNRQRRRVYRTLAHPRFRAAFDFLLLRHAASGDHAADVAYWQQLRAENPVEPIVPVSGDFEPADGLDAAEDGADAGAGSPRGPRRRHRRRRGPSAPAQS